MAEKVAVPAKYLRELSEGAAWQRRLAAEILNQHSSWTERSRLLVRTVDDQVRGVLSDSYRRLNSVELGDAAHNAAAAERAEELATTYSYVRPNGQRDFPVFAENGTEQ